MDDLGFEGGRELFAHGCDPSRRATPPHCPKSGVHYSKRTPQQIATELGLRPFGVERAANIRLFVLGRHFAHFSGDFKPDERAAWGLWPKVLRLVKERYELVDRSDVLQVSRSSDNYADGIEWLFHALRNDSPTLKRLPIDGEHEVKLGNVTLVIRSPHGVGD